MLQTHLDHLVVTAATLAEGADFILRQLGVRPVPGGAHPRMGTHNLLLRLGETVYLEVIARDPAAEAPDRPRWFGLDADEHALPRLATWVARTSDIVNMDRHASMALGEIEPMTRGTLNWHITVPEDGCPGLQGLAPALIQWEGKTHPAEAMPDFGCSLTALDAFHPDPAALSGLLRSVSFTGPVRVHSLDKNTPPYLIAHIDTPDGPRQLGGPAPATDSQAG